MEIAKALREAASRADWSPAQIAVAADATEAAVRQWLAGNAEPRAATYQKLRVAMPFFADLVDGKAVA